MPSIDKENKISIVTKELTLISNDKYEINILRRCRNLYIIDEQTILTIRRNFTLLLIDNLSRESYTSSGKYINATLMF